MTRSRLLVVLAVTLFAAACGDGTLTAPSPAAPRFSGGTSGGGGGGGGGTGVATTSLTGTWKDPTQTVLGPGGTVGSAFYSMIYMVVQATLKQSGTQITGDLRVMETNRDFGPTLPGTGQITFSGPVGRPAKITGSIQGSSVVFTVTGDLFDARQPNLVRTLVGTLSADGNTISAVSGSIFEMANIGANWSFVRQ